MNTDQIRSLVVFLLTMLITLGFGMLIGRNLHPDYEYMNQRLGYGTQIRHELLLKSN